MTGWLSDAINPDVERYILVDEGERIVEQVVDGELRRVGLVHKHWVVYLRAVAEVLGGILAFIWFLFSPVRVAWLPFLIAVVLFVHAAWLALDKYRDVFVITNGRVFRLNGVFDQRLATMPLTRILDITLDKPFIGRVLGYGHFVFETAAQEQGLRTVRYVGPPDELDLIIERAIVAAGLRPMDRSVSRRTR